MIELPPPGVSQATFFRTLSAWRKVGTTSEEIGGLLGANDATVRGWFRGIASGKVPLPHVRFRRRMREVLAAAKGRAK